MTAARRFMSSVPPDAVAVFLLVDYAGTERPRRASSNGIGIAERLQDPVMTQKHSEPAGQSSRSSGVASRICNLRRRTPPSRRESTSRRSLSPSSSGSQVPSPVPFDVAGRVEAPVAGVPATAIGDADSHRRPSLFGADGQWIGTAPSCRGTRRPSPSPFAAESRLQTKGHRRNPGRDVTILKLLDRGRLAAVAGVATGSSAGGSVPTRACRASACRTSGCRLADAARRSRAENLLLRARYSPFLVRKDRAPGDRTS